MYDEDADEIKDLILNFFPFDNSIQVIDGKKGKNLVKRVHLPPLKLEMLQIGNIVNIFSKLLYIKDCAPATRKILYSNVQRYYKYKVPIEYIVTMAVCIIDIFFWGYIGTVL